ncbi:hypothetical protein FRC15_001486 [Serendipita sp. 397]|nr:hypothetical protein FRC15_001486 [Serendipita sp. 397]
MYRHENDSTKPLSDGYKEQTVYEIPQKKRRSKWITVGLPLGLLVVAAGVVGVLFGLKVIKTGGSSSGSSSGSGSSGSSPNSHQNQDLNNLSYFATSTNSYHQPIYPSMTNTAQFGSPTFAASAAVHWPEDDFNPGQPSLTNLRSHPRLIAPKYKWDALTDLISKNAYLKTWNDIIMANATVFRDSAPVVHVFDGGASGSGILDPARETKNRIKHFAYAYRMTGDSAWIDRTYRELDNAMNWGDNREDPWNTAHFLDLAELTAAFAIGYDWLYDAWTDEQRTTIRTAIVNYGLRYGLTSYTDAAATYSWWHNVNGNWNCVSNGGMILGSLAILEDDTTGTASQLLPLAVANAVANCADVPSTDGTGSETANYWEFAITGLSELTSSLITATGSDQGMLSANDGLKLTSLFRMYVTGMTSLFDYGDHGPNKFSTTGNALLFLGSAFNEPRFTLYQRDRYQAAEPWSMFWYDVTAEGAWWNDLPLDHVFEDATDRWASFRSSWTDINGMFLAFKAGALLNHQTHGDLDCGDFIVDALGQRFFGEHGSDDYLNTNYFSNETQTSERWTLYRKMTEGQNVIAINGQNQLVSAQPTIRHDSSATAQGASTIFSVPSDSSAFVVADLTSAYGSNVQRGVRFLPGRRQVLVQDELTDVTDAAQWRAQTNATISIDTDGRTATLTLEGKKLVAQILSPEGVQFTDLPSTRTDNAPSRFPIERSLNRNLNEDMPPRGRGGGRRPSRASIGRASDLMGPPPAPPTSSQGVSMGQTQTAAKNDTASSLTHKILGPEVKALRECLIASGDSAATIAQIVNHHTDVYKLGLQRVAPNPPHALCAAWKRHAETYEDYIDTMEIQLKRALAAVEYQMEQEAERLRAKEQAEELQKQGNFLNKGRKPSAMFIDIPRFDEKTIDPLSVHPEINLKPATDDDTDFIMHDGSIVEEPISIMDDESATAKNPVPSGAAVPKEPGLSRTSRSSISLTSLNRHGLKLDLSNISLDGINENKSALAPSRVSGINPGVSGMEPVASPVTLAPKSARPRAGMDGEFPSLALDGLEFLSSTIQLPSGVTSSGIDATDDLVLVDDLFGDDEIDFGSNPPTGSGTNTVPMSSIFSTDNLMGTIKSEEMSIDLLGGNASTSGTQDKLFDDLGFGEMPANSSNADATTSNADLSLDGDLASFDFSVPVDNNLSNNATAADSSFGLEQMQQDQELKQQLQQRQQFGIGLNLPGELEVQLQLLDGNSTNEGVPPGDLQEFNFDFLGTDASTTNDGGFGTLFNQGSDGNNNNVS